MGKTDLAIENYLKAIDLGGALWYHMALAGAYSANNEILKAFPHFEKRLERDDEALGFVYINITIAYLHLGDYEKVTKYGQKAIESDICGASNPIVIAAQAQGKFQKIRQIADSVCQKTDCERGCYKFSFQASLLLGEFEKAEQYYYQWKNEGLGHPFWQHRMNYEIGYVLYQLGRKEEAGEIFTAEIQSLESELNIDSHRKLLDLARIFAFQGDRVKAIKYLAEYAKRGFLHGWHDYILIDPFFESLRDDPEFKAIVKQAQDEKAALRAQVREMEERGELTL
jgi:tetratricopeptide (TPR) repeat protein